MGQGGERGPAGPGLGGRARDAPGAEGAEVQGRGVIGAAVGANLHGGLREVAREVARVREAVHRQPRRRAGHGRGARGDQRVLLQLGHPRPVPRPQLEAQGDEVLRVGAQVQGHRRGGRALRDVEQRGLRGLEAPLVPRRARARHLDEGAAHAPDVRRQPGPVLPRRLRRHPQHRARQRRGRGPPRRAERRAGPEVGELDLAAVGHEDVRGLDVTVHDPEAVQVPEPLQQLRRVAADDALLEAPELVQQREDGAAGHVLEEDVDVPEDNKVKVLLEPVQKTPFNC